MTRYGLRISSVTLAPSNPTIGDFIGFASSETFTRPNIGILEQNRILLEATFLHIPFAGEDDDDCLEGPSLSVERRREACEYWLSIDNDSWKSDRIVHWCKFGCCSSVKESKLKLWIAIQVGDDSFFFTIWHERLSMNYDQWMYLVEKGFKWFAIIILHISVFVLMHLVCWEYVTIKKNPITNYISPMSIPISWTGCDFQKTSTHARHQQMDDMCESCPCDFVAWQTKYKSKLIYSNTKIVVYLFQFTGPLVLLWDLKHGKWIISVVNVKNIFNNRT